MPERDLTALSDDELRQEAATAILNAAILNRFPRFAGPAFDRTDAIYDEAVRRGKPSIYSHGWNDATASQGHPRRPVPPDPIRGSATP